MMDRWGPKHVELNLSADQNLLIKTTLCILLDYIYMYTYILNFLFTGSLKFRRMF